MRAALALAALAAALVVGPVASASAAPPAELFGSTCGGCHTLAAAGAGGTAGPSLDKSTETAAEIAALVAGGRGGMPAFKGILPEAQIAAIADYIVQARGKGQAKAPAPEPEPTASSGAATLTVAPRPHDRGELALAAQLPGAAGRPVAFFVVSNEFKRPAEIPIGTAEAAADGTARIVYRPTWNGEQRFVARLATSDAHAAAATAVYRVTASAPGPLYAGANPGRPLASVGRPFLDVILGLVALVWLSLAIMLAIAIGWMPRLAREPID